MNETVQGVIRHILTFVAGLGIFADVLPESEVDVIVAGIVAIVGVAWSIYNKNKDTAEV